MIATPPRPLPPPPGYHRSSAHARVHHAATPPPSPAQSDDIVILRAWIEAELAHAGERGAVLAAVDSAIQRCRDRRAGRVGTHYQAVPADVRGLVGRRDGEGMKAIVGRWDRDGTFMPGLAALTESEAKVYWWDLRGWRLEDIQREMTKDRLGSGAAMRAMWEGDRSRWVPIDDIVTDLESAAAKVRRVFGL